MKATIEIPVELLARLSGCRSVQELAARCDRLAWTAAGRAAVAEACGGDDPAARAEAEVLYAVRFAITDLFRGK